MRADLILEVITGDAVVRCSLSKESTRNSVSYIHMQPKQVEQLFQSKVKEGKLIFTSPKKLKGKALEDFASAKACKLLYTASVKCLKMPTTAVKKISKHL